MGEIEKQLDTLNLDTKTKEKIASLIGVAGEEFPCLNCPSKDDCNTFKWFMKWFGE